VLERTNPKDPGMQQRFHDQATDWCQWDQDSTPQAVLEGRNGLCGVQWEQVA
jgi:hypothetical protein